MKILHVPYRHTVWTVKRKGKAHPKAGYEGTERE